MMIEAVWDAGFKRAYRKRVLLNSSARIVFYLSMLALTMRYTEVLR
jgi:hypothetical protein